MNLDALIGQIPLQEQVHQSVGHPLSESVLDTVVTEWLGVNEGLYEYAHLSRIYLPNYKK